MALSHKALARTAALFAATLGIAALASCGGGGSSTAAAPTPVPTPSPSPAPSPAPAPAPVSSYPLAQRPGALAALLGKPKLLMVGLGTTSVAEIEKQGITLDINDQYLTDISTFGAYSWDRWGAGNGAYVAEVAANSDKLGALPMFTLYQMATWGDGNGIYGVQDDAFMKGYWDNVRLMFKGIKAYGKPTLVNFEPDFWGYAHRNVTDPAQHPARVASVNPDCATLPNNVVGFAHCLLQMARTQAPNAYVGFPPSGFGDLAANELNYMKQIGADKADFVVMQTLDRDAGCYEALFDEGSNCNRLAGTRFYYDETNQTEPSFKTAFAIGRSMHEGLGLPLLWWQTPLGVPSATPGGTRNAFRDNRTSYFLTHPKELVDAGSMGMIFSAGHPTQTDITTDGGQFQRLSKQYLGAPAALP
jgi:hypothetical protein